MHAVKHLLTPGTQGYALLRMGALASVFGLQFAVRRRARTRAEAEPEAVAAPSPRRDPHPRSKKKKRRRRDHGERG